MATSRSRTPGPVKAIRHPPIIWAAEDPIVQTPRDAVEPRVAAHSNRSVLVGSDMIRIATLRGGSDVVREWTIGIATRFGRGARRVWLGSGRLLGVLRPFALVAGGWLLQNVCAVSMRPDMCVETWRKCGAVPCRRGAVLPHRIGASWERVPGEFSMTEGTAHQRAEEPAAAAVRLLCCSLSYRLLRCGRDRHHELDRDRTSRERFVHPGREVSDVDLARDKT